MRDHSTKSESKTTDRQVSQLHHIQRNNVIVFNPRAISVAGRNFLRRQRWRFRPFKRLILPARSMKRAAVEFIGPFFGRTILRLEPSSLIYANTHTEISVREIHPAEVVRLPPHPFRTQTSSGELRVGPAFVFEIPNVNFWGYYGGAVVTADNAVLGSLSGGLGSSEPSNLFALAFAKVAVAQRSNRDRGHAGGRRKLLSLAARFGAESSFAQTRSPKIFPTTTRSCSTVRERIANAKSWQRLECPRRKFAMLIRANVSKSHRLFFLPWTSTLLLHGRFTDYAASFFLANKTNIAAFIFRGPAPQFAGSRMRTKSQRSCGIGISKLSKPKIFPGGNRQTCSPARV